MIRQMRRREENSIRTLLAKLSYEDQIFWQRQVKPLEEYLEKCVKIKIGEEIEGKNVIFVAEESNNIVGFCWCSIVDRGVDKQGEIAEFYVEKEYRSRGIGHDLVVAAKQLFINEHVEVAFVWTHHGNQAAIELLEEAGFKKVDQIVMAFVPSQEKES